MFFHVVSAQHRSSHNLAFHGKSIWTIPSVMGSRPTVYYLTLHPVRLRPLRRKSLPLGRLSSSYSRQVRYRNFTVFGLAVDLGTIQSTTSPVTWCVGYVRDPSITYTAPGGAIQKRRPYYATQYKTIEDAVSISACFPAYSMV